MEQNFFKIGNVVRLKGTMMNPFMTVSFIPPAHYIEKFVDCLWFDGAELKNGVFHQDTLNLIKE